MVSTNSFSINIINVGNIGHMTISDDVIRLILYRVSQNPNQPIFGLFTLQLII